MPPANGRQQTTQQNKIQKVAQPNFSSDSRIKINFFLEKEKKSDPKLDSYFQNNYDFKKKWYLLAASYCEATIDSFVQKTLSLYFVSKQGV